MTENRPKDPCLPLLNIMSCVAVVDIRSLIGFLPVMLTSFEALLLMPLPS